MYLYFKTIDFSQLSGVDFNWYVYVLAVLLGVICIGWGAFIWLLILRYLGADNITKYKFQLFYIYAKSWLARYIPGTAPWILGKIYFASSHGIPKKKLLTSSTLEALLQILATIMISFLLILSSRKGLNLTSSVYYLLIVGTLASILIVQPKVFNTIMRIGLKLIKKPSVDPSLVTHKINLIGTLLYSCGTIMTGFAMYLVALSVYPELGVSNIFYIMGVSTLSGVIGMLAIFVPSGLGVREGVQIALLSVIMPTEIAVIIAVASRLWSILADLLFYSITVAFYKRAQSIKYRNSPHAN